MKVEEKQLDINYDRSLVDFINSSAKEVMNVRPEGFGITVQEYMEEEGITEGPARRVLKGLVKSGVMEMKKMTLPGKAGSYSCVYYRPESEE